MTKKLSQEDKDERARKRAAKKVEERIANEMPKDIEGEIVDKNETDSATDINEPIVSTDIVPLDYATVGKTFLEIKPGIDFEEWEKVGHKLRNLAQGVMWWVGDWLNYGEQTYGEGYAQAMDATGYSYNTLKQAKYIASKFASDERDERLTFGHYQAVAGEPSDVAVALLTKAADEDLSIKDLKECKRETTSNNKTPKTTPPPTTILAECPECGHKFEVPK